MASDERKLCVDATPSRARAGIIALSYMACAVFLILFNKVALSTFKFNHANLITLLQLICSLVLLAALRLMDMISFTKVDEPIKGSRFVPFHTIKAIVPLSLSYLLYMIMGMASLRGVNLPMYTTLRRTTAVFTMAAEFALTGKRQPPKILASVGLMVLGAVVAGANDVSFDAHGYLLVFASNCATALYLGMISRYGKTSPLNSFGLMWSNGIVCVPILLAWTLANGEMSAALQYEHLYSFNFQIVLALSCTLAFALNYTIFMNTAVNSALTQTVCGNLKDGLVIIVGFHSFSDATYNPTNMGGILLGVIGSILYAMIKLS